jgi:DNA segregation ATPase FtsK/SpoIIIE-like protein
MHASFHAGTWCMLVHTACWHASVHESSADTPQTVTHVLGVMSFARPPILRISLLVVHTRSHIKSGSVPENSSDASPRPFFDRRFLLALDRLLVSAATDSVETVTPTAPYIQGDTNGIELRCSD